MKPGWRDQKQVAGQRSRLSHLTKGLGSLANGLIAAILVGLTLLVAAVLAMGEQDLVASQVPTATVSTPLSTATPSRSPTLEPSPVRPTPSAMPSPSPSPSLTPIQRPVPTAVARCLAPSSWRLYTVQSGESLASLAWRFSINEYGLIKANCLTSRTVRAGQRLYVPNVSPRQACGRPPGWVAYTVQRGDTLYRLALWYGTSVAKLKVANCLTSDKIIAGTNLWVPYVKPKPTSQPSHTPIPTKPAPTRTGTATAGPPPSDTATSEPATNTPVPGTSTAVPEPTNSPIPPTATVEPTDVPPPTATPVPPTSTPVPPQPTPIPPTNTPVPTEAL